MYKRQSQIFTVFSPTNELVPVPPVKVLKLSKVKVAVPSLAVPLKPCVALEPLSVAAVLVLSKVKLLATAAPAAALTCVILEKPPLTAAVVPV